MVFSSYTAMFRSLFLVLVLALTVRSSPHKKVVHAQPRKASASVRLSEDCLNQRDLKFPTAVEVSIRISKSHHAFRMVHDIRNRSLAPWDYRLDKDPNRFPQVIADAQCRLSGCVSPLGQEDRSLNSVPIKQEILVLRREQQGCRPTYRLEKKVITVGCTCVTPVIHHHS
ncbi:interleukin-17F-like isoform X2 [Neopelma chrysocephalum]|uniref:interleukin-17F-like isoform X2 n=1 Tax=Neopelma chrysocephalum TaxID=114329 RepID=UPI000FCCF075|nr:interleukin-17F-like isoform X2 [Neopelma chrysocephalum]XP_027528497.1 interleukin-17F-like isoform X2 [Neopelma chrysocephalum]XP_027528498.1 interleukin-17F-like isoform X2 [Neopelma chrysocephalum]